MLNDFLTLNLRFASKVQRASECVTEPQWAADAWGFTKTEGACWGGVLRPRPSEGPAALSGHAFRFDQNLLRKQKSPPLREEGEGPVILIGPVRASCLCGNDRARRTGEGGDPGRLRLSILRARRRDEAGARVNCARPNGRQRQPSRFRAAFPP